MSDDLPPDNSNADPRKPGRPAKENPRTEKLSCRLTEEEKAQGEAYCKKWNLTEAGLMRASYLAALAEPPDARWKRIVDIISQPLNEVDLSPTQKLAIRLKMKESMKRSAMLLLLVLLCGAAAPTIIKGVIFVYEGAKFLNYDGNTNCVYHQGLDGCELMPPGWKP